MPGQRDIEQLLRNIPIETAQQQSAATDVINTFVSLRNAAFDGIEYGGSRIAIPGTTTAFSVPALISDWQAGNYPEVAVTLIGIAGDAASAYSFLMSAAVEAGAVTGGVGAAASSGVVAGMLGEAAGPAGLAAAVLVATFRIPGGANENLRKLFFIADASGILTSWLFNNQGISPHQRLLQRARSGGYNRADVSDACEAAHRQVHALWQSRYRGNADAKRQARASARDNWENYWIQVGTALSNRLGPSPSNAGLGWVRSEISRSRRSMEQARRDASMARLQAQQQARNGFIVLPNGMLWPVD